MSEQELTADEQPPLAGLRILDLTRLLPGPLATLHLADLGADVIKIEDPAQGDYARWMGPLKKSQSGWFLAINRNKRSIALDLKSASGVQVLLDLVKSADAVIESFRPGVMDRLGIGFSTLIDINPALVVCSISGYGQTGPDRLKSGHDLNYCAQTGLLDQMGSRQHPPAPGNFQIADVVGGALSAAMSVLAALLSVARGGPGRQIDIAMADCAAANGIMTLMELDAYGATRDRGDGFLSGRLPNYGVYRTSDDRYMAVGALEQKFWELLCHTLEEPALAEVDQSSDTDCHVARLRLGEIFGGQTQAHWAKVFINVDCCTGPVLTLAEAMQDPQLQSRGLFFTTDHPLEGEVTQYACPVKMSDFTFSLRRHAPSLGEHTAEILQDLGYSGSRISMLTVSGAAG